MSTHIAPDVDVSIEIEQSTLYNKDLAPVPPARRTWRVGSFAALWISMSACIPTYMLASSLIGGGMNWSQAILTIFLGNLIVVIPMILNAHAGTRYGIPFPVFCRASFGTRRRECARAAARVCRLRLVRHPDVDRRRGDLQDPRRLLPGARRRRARRRFSASRSPEFVCFLFFWAINMFVVYKGIESIRLLLNIKAPLLIALGLAAARVGLSGRRRLRADPLAAVRVRSGSAESRTVLGVLHSRR